MRLLEATLAEKVSRDALTASAWGRQLSTEQFLAREAALRSHPFAKTSMRTWLWGGESILSSCETFEVAATRGATSGRAFIVASVFTEPSLRVKGHAVAMLNALVERLSTPDALAVVLFSEVGPSLYERAGFVGQPGVDLVFPARAAREGVSGAAHPSASVVMPRREQTAGDDARHSERTSDVRWTTAIEAPPHQRGDSHAVTLVLSAQQCDWHVERERFYASVLHRPAPPAHVARLNASSLAVAASFQRNELHVLWTEFHDDADGLALLEACAALAQRCGLPAVRVWETRAMPTPTGATRVERNDELPMLRPLDGGAARWTNVTQGLWA
ncbi:MAG: hypothetical protein Q8S33_38030 [Myxococcales bacterium]|nr:hypothetical protein [Myxococcales bacterium]